jgi:hypothetical protein
MSLEVLVAVQVGERDERLINIGRTETVQLPAHPDDMGDSGIIDLADLVDAVMRRLVDEVRIDAVKQLAQIKDLQKR